MYVRFHHTQAFAWEKIAEGEAGPDDVVATNAQGDLVRRIVIESPDTVTHLEPTGLDRINEGREDAGLARLSDFAVLSRHLSDAVVGTGHHFDLADLTAIECDDKEMEGPLAAYFGVPVYEEPAESAHEAAPAATTTEVTQ